jgi:formylglycine-generating enzyme required for sulfatase activity
MSREASENPPPHEVRDLSGNVAEWSHTPHLKTIRFAEDNEGGDRPVGEHRLLRGGSSAESARTIRCAFHSRHHAAGWLDTAGFRTVVAPERPAGV